MFDLLEICRLPFQNVNKEVEIYGFAQLNRESNGCRGILALSFRAGLV
jgi:hypothetical protein